MPSARRIYLPLWQQVFAELLQVTHPTLHTGDGSKVVNAQAVQGII
jgi:hypothetical protein